MNNPTIPETLAYLREEKLKQAEPHQGYYDVAIERLEQSCSACEYYYKSCCCYGMNDLIERKIDDYCNYFKLSE